MKQELRAVQFYRQALARGCAQGLALGENFTLAPCGGGAGSYFTRMFDTGETQGTFHRLTVDGAFGGVRLEVIAAASDTLEWVVDNESVMLPAFLSDPAIDPGVKRRALCSLRHVRAVDSPDILLHALRGRYVFVAVTLTPESGRGRLTGVRLEFPKVLFTQYFPEIYQEDDFFDRFISIFQSVYLDMERRVGELPALLDYESAPDELVGALAGWLGLDNPGGLLSPAQLRRMIGRLDLFQGARGTKRALEALIELAAGVTPAIFERFRWDVPGLPAPRRQLLGRLYGESFDSLCILIDVSRREEEPPFTERELERLAEGYCLLGTQCRVVLLRPCSRADTHCYLGVNSALSAPEEARADGARLGGHIVAG